MLNKLFKSIIDTDNAPIVICNLNSDIVYMNPSAIARYGKDLTGRSLKSCHNADSNDKIDKVLRYFSERKDVNTVYTYYNEKENKDVYMVALRDTDGELIGYYEKHEYRNRETGRLYEIW